MAERGKSVDLTEGNLFQRIILFALPILLGQVFQNLYNSVDSIVVGNFVGTSALAAVTSSADISQMLVGFFTGLSVGSGVVFSRYFGAKDYQKLHDSIHTALAFSAVLGLLMCIIGIILTPQLLHMVKCPDDVYPEALTYLRIYLIGVLFTSIYNVASGVLRSVGDSHSPFVYLVLASFTNIALDLFFVVVLDMGVAGVAIATILSQSESVILVTRKMLRTTDVYRLVLSDLKIDTGLLKQIMSIGMPAAIQACMISFSNLFVQRYINEFGMKAMAGAGAAKKIDRYVGLISLSFGQATTTFVSQCVGADRYERAFQGLRVTLIILAVTVVVTAIPTYIYAEQFVRLFTQDEEAIAYGVLMVRTMMPLYYFQSLHQVFSNAVRGFGKSLVTLVTTILGLIVCRQLYLAIALSIRHEIQLVYLSYPVGWASSAILAFIAYMKLIRLPYNRRKQQEQAG